MFRECADSKERQRLFLWRREHDVDRDVKQTLPYVTPHKLMKYTDRQYPALCERKTKYGGLRYRDMQSIVSEYRDYLDMCVKLGNDLVKPFYTIEIRGGKVVQVRGMKNCQATPEVNAFMTQWESQVLHANAAA